MADPGPYKTDEVEDRLRRVNDLQTESEREEALKHTYDHHHHGNEKLIQLDEHMKKYDTDGDGVFSPDEVRNIVRDMEIAQKSAKSMGRIAAVVGAGGFVMCLALIGLMVAANEASKESHVEDGGIMRDLDGNPVQNKGLQSFAAMRDFPTLASAALNELTYLSFGAKLYGSQSAVRYSMRFSVSSWLREDSTKQVTLFSQEGSIIVISGSAGCSGNDCMTLTTLEGGVSTKYTIETAASDGRRLLGKNGMHCSNKLFTSVEKLHQCMFGGDGSRRLEEASTVGVAALATEPSTAGLVEYNLFNEQCAICQTNFMPYDSFPADPVIKSQCKCYCDDAGRRLQASGGTDGSSAGFSSDVSSSGQQCCPCAGAASNDELTEEVSFYRTEDLGGAESQGSVQRFFYDSAGFQGWCYNLIYFTGPDTTCSHPDAYPGMACANFGTPEEMYCNPDVSVGACARCREDPNAPFVPTPIARRQRRALTTRQRRERARGRDIAQRVLHFSTVDHNHTGSCANTCGGPGIAPPGQTSDCDCGNTCEAFGDCCVDFSALCVATGLIASIDLGTGGDVFTFAGGNISASNLVGTQGTVDANGILTGAPLDSSSTWSATYSNTTETNAPDYAYQVYDDSIEYELMCSTCAYGPPSNSEPQELYAFDVRFAGLDGEAVGGLYPTEIQWTIEEGSTGSHKLVEEPYEWDLATNQYRLEQDVKVEMQVGAHTLHMFDSYGDGWNSAEWQLYHWNTNNPVLGFSASGALAPITCSFEHSGEFSYDATGNDHHEETDTTRNEAGAFGHRQLKVTDERQLVSDANRRQLHYGEGCDTLMPGKCAKCEFTIPPEAEIIAHGHGGITVDPGYVLASAAVELDAAAGSDGGTFSPTTQPTLAPTCNWVCN
jgi:hypothetical protein